MPHLNLVKSFFHWFVLIRDLNLGLGRLADSDSQGTEEFEEGCVYKHCARIYIYIYVVNICTNLTMCKVGTLQDPHFFQVRSLSAR
jgi:hypothetical protein